MQLTEKGGVIANLLTYYVNLPIPAKSKTATHRNIYTMTALIERSRW